jgi:hypothetical protein
VNREHMDSGLRYGELVDADVAERAKVKGATMAKIAWARALGEDGLLYKNVLENGPLMPASIVEVIGVERMQEAAQVLLEVDILSAGEWSEIEAMRTSHAGLMVLLTLAEVARERQEGATGGQ